MRYKSYFLDVGATYRQRTDLKVYLEIFLSLITISVFAIFALRPTLLTIAELVKEIETKKETLETMNAKLEDIRTAQNLFDQQGNKIRYIKKAVPTLSSVDVFTRQIEALTSKHSTAVSSIVIGETLVYGTEPIKAKSTKKELVAPFPDNASEMQVAVNIEAPSKSYRQLYSYLQDFERLRWPIRLDRVGFNKSLNDDNIEVLVMTVEGRLPYMVHLPKQTE